MSNLSLARRGDRPGSRPWAAILVMTVLAGCGDEAETTRECRNGMAAFAAATDFARGRLALPPLATDGSGSVQIPGGRSEYQGDCRHRVVSYVDRQDTEGNPDVPRQQRFESVVRFDGKAWILESISFY